MSALIDRLSDYAAYHRDRRNVATHLVGVPLIVFGVVVLLSRPVFDLGGIILSPAIVAAIMAVHWTMRTDNTYGIVLTLLLAAALAAGHTLGRGDDLVWLVTGLGCFVVGWIIQFVGHAFEGRKPAFMDDIRGLLVGPLFVVAEAGFLVGWRLDVKAAVEARVGAARSGKPLASGR